MTVSSITSAPALSSCPMAFTFVCHAPTRPHRMVKLNASFAPLMMSFAPSFSRHTFPRPYGLRLSALPPTSSILCQQRLNFSTPHFALFGSQPSYEHLRVFGCTSYPNLSATAPPPHKLSMLCVFLCNSPHHKGYICLDRHTNRIIISRHVVFDESSFPFSKDSTTPTRAAFDFLDDFPNPVPAPFMPSPCADSAGHSWRQSNPATYGRHPRRWPQERGCQTWLLQRQSWLPLGRLRPHFQQAPTATSSRSARVALR